MKGSSSALGCSAMAGAVAFSSLYVWRLVAAVLDGQPLQGRAINEALSNAGVAGFLVFIVIFILVANDAWVAGSKRKQARRKLMKRAGQSDKDFCLDIPEVDRKLALRLRKSLANLLDVPPEKIYSTDRLHEELKAGGAFESFYTDALGGRSIYEVSTDEVLDIVDKSDPTVPQSAKEIRQLTEWTKSQADQAPANDERLGEPDH